MEYDMEDTIAAISTALGEGGIGIVRISGSLALPIAKKIFKGRPLEDRKMTYGHIYDNFSNECVDEVMTVYMKGPHSYTAEDVVEIQCHGSIVALRKILALTLKNGARMAEAGEFTKRAFLNGRMDLSQAEAVTDLIRAKSDRAFDVALSQLEGDFSREIRQIRQALTDLLVNIAVNIDYPDEDIEELTYAQLMSGLKDVRKSIKGLLETAETGRLMKEGLNVVIAGSPNVGKSSLMNGLLGENRAIVTEIPGTTRDTIEELISVRGIPVRLADTAGIHETEDVIEKIGIEKSKDTFNRADLILFMVDGSRPLSREDEEIMEYLPGRRAVILINKSDLPRQIDIYDLRGRLSSDMTVLETSMKDGQQSIGRIEDEIEKMVYGGKVRQGNSLMVTNLRHKELLEKAEESLSDAMKMTGQSEPPELIEIDVNHAYELLGEIIGETAGDDIIDEVFSRFCLGK